MTDSDAAATNGSGHSAKSNKLVPVSARKLKANRENAKKSTGPRTLRGKAHSCLNALKHGLFVRHFLDFISLHESPREYEDLLNGLWEQYQPVGKAEELEVERVAVCWWKLKRAWRYENAVNHIAVHDVGRRELAEEEKWCKERDKEDESLILELESAEKEIHDTGELSQETKQKLFAMSAGFEPIWSAIERSTQEKLKEPAVSRIFQKLSPKECSSVLALHTVTTAIGMHKPLSGWRYARAAEITTAPYLVPNRDALDRLLRYETTIDRALNRALDRMERLQRRRRGEPLLPPLSLRLTQ